MARPAKARARCRPLSTSPTASSPAATLRQRHLLTLKWSLPHILLQADFMAVASRSARYHIQGSRQNADSMHSLHSGVAGAAQVYRPLLETRRKALEMCAEVKQKRNDGASTEAHLLATRKTLVVVEVLLHGPCDMHRACRMVRQPQFNLLPVKSALTWEAEQLLRPTQRVKAYSTTSHSIRQVPRAQEKTMQLTHHARRHPVTVGVQTTSRRGGRPRGV